MILSARAYLLRVLTQVHLLCMYALLRCMTTSATCFHSTLSPLVQAGDDGQAGTCLIPVCQWASCAQSAQAAPAPLPLARTPAGDSALPRSWRDTAHPGCCTCTAGHVPCLLAFMSLHSCRSGFSRFPNQAQCCTLDAQHSHCIRPNACYMAKFACGMCLTDVFFCKTFVMCSAVAHDVAATCTVHSLCTVLGRHQHPAAD